jgi:hypothetical protein
MKRVLVASILGIAASVSTYGQGVINFDNYNAGTAPVIWGTPAPGGYTAGEAVSDTSIIIGLYAGPGVQASSTGITTLLGTTPIWVSAVYGGGFFTVSGLEVAIPTTLWTGSQTVSFQLRPYSKGDQPVLNWTDTIWQETSDIVSISLPANNMTAQTQLVLTVPEPSTIALAGLGAAALLAARKRQ